MTRDHAFLTVLFGLALALSGFQAWYIHLPLEEAALVDWCRFTETVDCYRSLARHGASLDVVGVNVFMAIFTVLLTQFLLSVFAWTSPAPRREAFYGAAMALSFLVSGLAVFVLLNDFQVFVSADLTPGALKPVHATSASSVGIAFFSGIVNVIAIVRGIGRLRAPGALLGQASVVAAAALVAVLVHTAGRARRDVEETLREREAAPPQVRVPAFWRAMPRTGAAHLGDASADRELLVFVDPAQDASRALVAALLTRLPQLGGDRVIYLFAPGAAGRVLIEAHKNGTLETYLRTWEAAPPTDPASERIAARQAAAATKLGVTTYPTVVTKDGSGTTLPGP
ncbi:MAG: hypothetical protein OER88_07900 [Planctomycetota bacterium]|nr:hypothetical protein [Planctomycetota bacterium]